MTLWLGIDPGFSGALAVCAPGPQLQSIIDMPVVKDPKGRTVLDMHTLYDNLEIPEDLTVCAVLERVSAMPGQGSASTFRFGEGYGAIQMALAARKIRTHRITPTVWKKHFGLSKVKGASRGLAQQMFPNQAHLFNRVKDDGRAEAALLALYGIQKLSFP